MKDMGGFSLNVCNSQHCLFFHCTAEHHKDRVSAAFEGSYTSVQKQQALTFEKFERFCVQRKLVEVKEHVSL